MLLQILHEKRKLKEEERRSKEIELEILRIRDKDAERRMLKGGGGEAASKAQERQRTAAAAEEGGAECFQDASLGPTQPFSTPQDTSGQESSPQNTQPDLQPQSGQPHNPQPNSELQHQPQQQPQPNPQPQPQRQTRPQPQPRQPQLNPRQPRQPPPPRPHGQYYMPNSFANTGAGYFALLNRRKCERPSQPTPQQQQQQPIPPSFPSPFMLYGMPPMTQPPDGGSIGAGCGPTGLEQATEDGKRDLGNPMMMMMPPGMPDGLAPGGLALGGKNGLPALPGLPPAFWRDEE
ncbi:hypothetical protein HK104_005764, partial [Borealophlyctis nickersoniae]